MNIKGMVSVVVPVYNREQYVGQCIESILAQTYDNYEIILVNDGSTDNSLAVIESYHQQYADKIVVIDQHNQGQVASRNNAIAQAKGQYVAFLDSDDLWYPDKLSLQLPLFTEQVGLVYCAIENIDPNGKILSTEYCDESLTADLYPHLLVQNRMTGGAVVVLKSALDHVGVFDAKFKAAENWDLWLRVCREYKAAVVNKVLVKYRIHPGNMSKDGLLMLAAKESIIEKHCSDLSASPRIAVAYKKAKADLAYRYGLYYFVREQYTQARESFRQANKAVPSYKDVKQRIFRTYLGKTGNRLLSRLKKRLSKG